MAVPPPRMSTSFMMRDPPNKTKRKADTAAVASAAADESEESDDGGSSSGGRIVLASTTPIEDMREKFSELLVSYGENQFGAYTREKGEHPTCAWVCILCNSLNSKYRNACALCDCAPCNGLSTGYDPTNSHLLCYYDKKQKRNYPQPRLVADLIGGSQQKVVVDGMVTVWPPAHTPAPKRTDTSPYVIAINNLYIDARSEPIILPLLSAGLGGATVLIDLVVSYLRPHLLLATRGRQYQVAIDRRLLLVTPILRRCLECALTTKCTPAGLTVRTARDVTIARHEPINSDAFHYPVSSNHPPVSPTAAAATCFVGCIELDTADVRAVERFAVYLYHCGGSPTEDPSADWMRDFVDSAFMISERMSYELLHIATECQIQWLASAITDRASDAVPESTPIATYEHHIPDRYRAPHAWVGTVRDWTGVESFAVLKQRIATRLRSYRATAKEATASAHRPNQPPAADAIFPTIDYTLFAGFDGSAIQ